MGHHNIFPQPQDVNCHYLHHPQGEMVSQNVYPTNCVQSLITKPQETQSRKRLQNFEEQLMIIEDNDD